MPAKIADVARAESEALREANLAVRPALLAMGSTALAEVLRFEGPADLTLRRFFKQHPRLGRRDRGFIAETVFAALRRLRFYTHVGAAESARRLFIAAAANLPAHDRRNLAQALSAREMDWIAQLASASSKPAPLGVAAELPDWLIQRLFKSATRAQILALGQAMQAPAPLDLRVNTLLTPRDHAVTALRDSGYRAAPTPYSPLGLRVEGKPALEQHPLFIGGQVEVQDEGSQLLGFLLAPRRREMVVDFCAGAGGKTLLLGQLMRSEGRLYAFDVSDRRLLQLRKRLKRSGLSNVHPEVITHENDARLKRLAGKIDRVLVDAPCTGTGTLRRNPDLKWRLAETDFDALRHKQAAILEAASRLLKPGGRLVYATCSILAEENQQVVDDFLCTHPQFGELDCEAELAKAGIAIDCGSRLQLLPQRHGTDGFFAAVLELKP